MLSSEQAQQRRRPFSQFSSSMRSCRRRLSRRRFPPLASPPPPTLPSAQSQAAVTTTTRQLYSRKRRSSIGAAAVATDVPRSFNFCSTASVINVVATPTPPPRSPAHKRRRGFEPGGVGVDNLNNVASCSGSGLGLLRRLRDSLRRPFLTRSSRPRKYRLNTSGIATNSNTASQHASSSKPIAVSSASLCHRSAAAAFWRLRTASPSPSPSGGSPTPVRRPPQSPLLLFAASSSTACQRMAACSTARRCQTPTTAAAVAGGAGRPSPSHHHQQQQQQQQQHRAPLGAYNLPPPGQGHASAGREYQNQVLLPAGLAAHQYYEPAAHSLPVQQQASPQQLSSGKKTSDSTLWDHRPAAGDPGHNTSMASGQPAYYSSVAGSAAVITASASCNQPQQQPPLGMRGSRERASYAHGVSFVSSEQQQQQQPQQQPLQQQSSSGATPTQGRKSRRRSNLFSRKDEQQQQQQQQAMSAAMSAPTSTVGSGRAIPMKQGYLYKRSAGGALSRADWKKKYAALAETGQLTYYASLHDYMADSHGKTIDLRLTTVKVPGQTRPTSNGLLLKTQLSQQQQQSAQSSQHPQRRRAKSSGRGGGGGIGDSAKTPDDDCSIGSSSASGTPAALGPPGSGFEFTIVSLDNRTWQFEAPSQAERDDWVRSIEQGILRQLQLLGRDGNPVKNGAGAGASSASNTSPLSSASGATSAAATASAAASVQLLRDILGNNVCADCGRPDPDWASINLGVLLCIECSGVHRNLGTHLSRVRSLNLDDWPANNVLVMRAIGNRLANSVWEARLDSASGVYKPNADSPRELKEQFIRAKYERREFLPELPYPDCPIQQQLVDAIARSDTRQVILCLAVAGPAVNRAYSQQDPRAAVHIAATLGQLPYLQLLLWYGADPAVRDAEGRTGHFYAAAAGKPDCAEFLLLAGCPPTNLMSTSMTTTTNNTASTAAATSSSVSSSSRRRSSRTASPTSPTNATMEIGL